MIELIIIFLLVKQAIEQAFLLVLLTLNRGGTTAVGLPKQYYSYNPLPYS